jgi:hypothetical protein
MPTFQIEDYVFVKDGLEFSYDQLSDNWAGKIVHYDKDEALYHVLLDAKSLPSINDEYLEHMDIDIEEGVIEWFEEEDIVLAHRRDTDESYAAALAELNERYDEVNYFEEEEEDDHEAFAEDFLETPQFAALSDEQKEHAAFAVSVFIDYLNRGVGGTLNSLTLGQTKETLTYYIAGKVSAENEFFEHFCFIIEQFLISIKDTDDIEIDKEIIKFLRESKQKFYHHAINSDNWHMAKSMVMMSRDENGEFDQDKMNSLIGKPFPLAGGQQNNWLNSFVSNIPLIAGPKIGRNDKVTVEYQNGTITSDIKYKKVEQDIKDGRCKLI